MKRKIHIYRSFEEQQQDTLNNMRSTTISERFEILYRMQQLTNRFHPPGDSERKIIILHEPAGK